jgi:hypothetical protein
MLPVLLTGIRRRCTKRTTGCLTCAWGGRRAKEVPNTATLNAGGAAAIESVSCPPAGGCTAGGYYSDSSGIQQPFVVSQVNGTYGQAEEVPGIATLNTLGAQIDSLSCASAGNCSAGGWYSDSSGHEQVLVDSQAGGARDQAEESPAPTLSSSDRQRRTTLARSATTCPPV